MITHLEPFDDHAVSFVDDEVSDAFQLKRAEVSPA